MNKSILIRCDASIEIGTGHVMRCLNLARSLRQREILVVFLCRELHGDLRELIRKEFEVVSLKEITESSKSSYIDPLETSVSTWLGCSQRQDADDCIEAIRHSELGPIDWLVVDHYGIDHTWEKIMYDYIDSTQGSPPKVLVIDDLANREHYADMLVDSNRQGSDAKELYAKLVSPQCRILLGPTYAPIDQLYGQLQPVAPVRNRIQRVLVFFGGVDHANFTAKILMVLKEPDFENLSVDIVLGPKAPHYAMIAEIVRCCPRMQLYSGLGSMAGLILRADLAIGAAGISSWERAALALPSIVMAVADNQQESMKTLIESDAAVGIDLRTARDPDAQVSKLLRRFKAVPELLPRLSEGAMQLGDGRGCTRLATAMFGPRPQRRLRPATITDETVYYNWANEHEVRQQSFSKGLITWSEHQCWFRKRLQSPKALLLVLADINGLPLGQIRFERAENHIPCCDRPFH